MNKELIILLLKFAGVVVVVMGLILLCCVVTPRLAKRIEKKLPQNEDADGENENGVKPEDYEVQGPFDPQKLDEYDLNYKIYNKDIYGVDFRHGKKQKRKDG